MIANRFSTIQISCSTGESVLRLRGVSKSYGNPPHQVEVLHEIDLDIRAGQLALVMGPSGSGKTTLLTIAGLLAQPTRGAISLAGRDVTLCREGELPAIRRRNLSFIFQSFNLLGALTAMENVQVGLELQGIRGRSAVMKSLHLLASVGLEERADHRPAELSGGEKQRVAIARALASPAKLILADEPTGNLDGHTAIRVVQLLQELVQQEGRAVVMVTHDSRLETMADRIVRLEDGSIVSDE